ncbi:MAG: hypothetical protein V7720_14420 [Halioglobus sp.]
MKISWIKNFGLAILSVIVLSINASAEDIDIFAGTSNTGSAELPNVIFVLDNTANWSREGQKWPDGTQGESEARAVSAALESMIGEINVGLMLYGTQGNNATRDGGYVRIDLQELTGDYYHNFVKVILKRIEDNINDSNEMRDASNTYGYIPYDVYNYLKGDDQSKLGVATPSKVNPTNAELLTSALADPDAYSSQWDTFASPLNSDAICADTYMIYIGNNKNGSIAGDDATNTAALIAAYSEAGVSPPDALAGESGSPLPVPGFSCSSTVITPPSYLGLTNECYRTAADCGAAVNDPDSVDEDICAGTLAGGETCACTATSGDRCSNSGNPKPYRWAVDGGGEVETECLPTNTNDDSAGADYNLDDWSKFLFLEGVPFTYFADVDGDDVDDEINQRVKVITYMVDVFNKQQLPELSSVWFSAANAGGGRYFQAKSESAILDALEISLGEIIAKSSSFAAVTLPLSATNRTQVENEVYIGMFRPEQGKDPRWYGNLKRYQLALFNGVARLADVNYTDIISSQTGFPNDCAISFWTEDSPGYWNNLGISPSVESQCSSLDPNDPDETYSDMPDGPFVEKGGVGQQIRKLSTGSQRKLITLEDPNNLVLLSTIDPDELTDPNDLAVLGSTIYSFFIGDASGADEVPHGDGSSSLMRTSVHGDVVHSRPLTVRYDENTVVLYYGANDGLFRAVDATSGSELWGFLAPEHYGKIQRLHDDAPVIDFEGALVDPNEPDAEPKDYFFDGPTGFHVQYDDPNDPAVSSVGELQYAYIYPTMRRGGRMVYGFDVEDPNDPKFMWKQGCDDEGNCTDATDFGELGNTWSTPQGVFVGDYVSGGEPAPLLIFGGGYDACLDIDQASYPSECAGATGKGVYVLDAISGDLVAKFDTDAPVITDISTIDLDSDGVIELAYVADAAGGIYRIRFTDYTSDMAGLTTIPADSLVDRVEQGTGTSSTEWVIEKIASMPEDTRRFYNSPTASPLPTLGYIAVTIGSGDRERPLDTNYPYTSDVQNRFYAFLDVPYVDWLAGQSSSTWERTEIIDLEDPNEMYEVGTNDGVQLRNYQGWWMDLPNRGEQVANASVVGAGKVFFNTFQPGGEPDEICGSPIGIGRAYAIDLFTPVLPVGENTIDGGGIPIPPIIATVEIPPGCTEDCDGWTPEDCEGDGCDSEVRTGIIGWDGFEFTELDPELDPTIQRVFFTEDIDRE